MSWPVEFFDDIMQSIAREVTKGTGIDSYIYVKAPLPNIKPHIYIQFGGCVLQPPDPPCFAKTGQQEGILTTIPLEFVLEFKGSGEIFAGKSLLYSANAGTYLYNEIRSLPMTSTDITKTSVSTGDPVNIFYKGLNAALHVETPQESISFKPDIMKDSWLFQQVWSGKVQFRLSTNI